MICSVNIEVFFLFVQLFSTKKKKRKMDILWAGMKYSDVNHLKPHSHNQILSARVIFNKGNYKSTLDVT